MNNGVFISYRRAPAAFIARAVYQDLKQHGYDVFLDVQSIDSGAFTIIIERQIRLRRFFVLILTQETLNRCQQVDDMMRREIMLAFESQRVIIPFATDTFDWGDIQRYLPPELHGLALMNSVPKVSHEWFEAAMERLRTRHLKLPEYETGEMAAPSQQPAPPAPKRERPPAPQPEPFEEAVPEQEETMIGAVVPEELMLEVPAVTMDELTAEALTQRAASLRQQGDWAGALHWLEQALALRPDYASAWLQRGLVRLAQDDNAGSIPDFQQALALNAQLADAYGGLAMAHMALGQADQAQKPLTAGLQVAPNDAGLLFIKAHLEHLTGAKKDALATMQRVHELNPDYPTAAATLAQWRKELGWRRWFG
ncbi:MAG: tetratricopeptide repeat protein [Aggregatilineales bacterium]